VGRQSQDCLIENSLDSCREAASLLLDGLLEMEIETKRLLTIQGIDSCSTRG